MSLSSEISFLQKWGVPSEYEKIKREADIKVAAYKALLDKAYEKGFLKE